MLKRIARLAIAAPGKVLMVAGLLAVLLGIFGVPVADALSSSGQDPTAESSRAARLLTEKFGQGNVPLVIVVTAPDRYDSPRTVVVVTGILDQLNKSGKVAGVTSAWTTPQPANAALLSADQRSGLIVTGIVGDEASTAGLHQGNHRGYRRGPQRRAGSRRRRHGEFQVTEQSKRDLLVLEAIVVPLSFLVLIWVFGGLVSSPRCRHWAGVLAILGSLAVLRAVTSFTDVSIFAPQPHQATARPAMPTGPPSCPCC